MILNKNGIQYYQHNSHGDVIGITDLAKNWLIHYGYDAFGEEILGYIDNTGNNFKYCGEYFDAESGSYYLRARYYQPSIGRFTTEDPHWNTGNMIYGDNPVKINGRKNPYNPHNPEVFAYMPDISAVVQSGNLYGYCLNSPLSWFDYTGQNAGNNFQNKDGTYSLYDNDRFVDNNAWHEQLFVVEPSGPSIDLKNGSVGIGSIEGTVFTGGWEWKNANLSLFDLGHASAGLECKDGKIEIGAQASVWSPSASVTVGDVGAEIGVEVGAIGANFNGTWTASKKGFEIYIAIGIGVTLSFWW